MRKEGDGHHGGYLGDPLPGVVELQSGHIHEVESPVHQSQEPLLRWHRSQLLDRLTLLLCECVCVCM